MQGEVHAKEARGTRPVPLTPLCETPGEAFIKTRRASIVDTMATFFMSVQQTQLSFQRVFISERVPSGGLCLHEWLCF